jgi:hypothetical protein
VKTLIPALPVSHRLHSFDLAIAEMNVEPRLPMHEPSEHETKVLQAAEVVRVAPKEYCTCRGTGELLRAFVGTFRACDNTNSI